MQAQCPQGTTTVSDSAVKQTGQRGVVVTVNVGVGGGGSGSDGATVAVGGSVDSVDGALGAAIAVAAAARRAGRSRRRRRLDDGDEVIVVDDVTNLLRLAGCCVGIDGVGVRVDDVALLLSSTPTSSSSTSLKPSSPASPPSSSPFYSPTRACQRRVQLLAEMSPCPFARTASHSSATRGVDCVQTYFVVSVLDEILHLPAELPVQCVSVLDVAYEGTCRRRDGP